MLKVLGIITIDSITCFDANDGQLTINPIGGTQPPALTIDWYNVATGLVVGTGNTTNDTLPPGQYYALITDDNGCDTISDTITLLNPLELKASVTSSTNPICFGDNNGSITIKIDSILQGKGGVFQFTQTGGAPWFDFPTLKPTEVTFSALFAGVYSNIRVRDVDLCEYSLPADTLIEPSLLEFSIDNLSYNGLGVSCNGICDAQITIDSVWGGNLPPYGNNSSYFGGVIFTDTLIGSDTCGSIAGIDYSYVVTDSLGCEGNNSITIFEPPVFSISAATPLLANGYNVSCPSTCDGIINVSPNNGVDTINYFVSSFFESNTFAFGAVSFDSICGINTNNGQDTIIAIDANQCVDTFYISLLEPDLFTFDIDSINENCSLNNGKAWVSNFIGGLSPYNYSWTGPVGTGPFPNNDTIENLSYGQYNVTVTDAMLCDTTISIFVDSSFILLDPIVARVACNDIDNAEITIDANNVLLSQVMLVESSFDSISTNTIIDYDSPYLPNGQLDQNPNIIPIMTFGNLTSGWYEIRVELYALQQGGQGCPSKSYYINIGDSVSMHATLNDTLLSDLDLSCFGDSTSQIEIEVFDTFVDSLGNTLQGSPWNNSYGADYSASGVYTNKGTAPFNVLFTPTPLPGIQSYLTAGNYSIIINATLDVHTNCFDTVDVIVNQPDSLEFTLKSTPTSCNGGIDGTASIDAISGGTTPYTYIWRDSIGGLLISNLDAFITELNTFPAGVPAGIYELSVTDAAGCAPAVSTVQVLQPDSITYSIVIDEIDICASPNQTGQFTITSIGGVGSHTYHWWNSDSSYTTALPSPIGLVSDWYFFIVTDDNGCITATDSIFMPNGVDPILDLSFVNHVSCFGVADGNYIAVVDSTNPLGSSASPFEFWNPNFGTTGGYDPSYTPENPMTGPDTIIVRIRDAITCESFDTIIVTQPDLLKITSLTADTFIGGYSVSCYGILDGAITFDTVVGGTPSYTYWLQDTNSVQNPLSTNPLFDTLAATYYKAFVVDANGCLDSLVITLTQPLPLVIDSFNIFTYIGGNNVSCLGFNDGLANVYASGGNDTYSYLWSNGNITDTAYALLADTFSVVVTDPNGCIVSDSISLTEPTLLVINNIFQTDLLCKGGDRGNATVFVSGATPGYTYLWDNANSTIPTYNDPSDTVHSTADITPFADTLRAGWNSVEVWDTNGCYIKDSVLLIEPIISITIDSLDIVQMTCFNYNNASAVVYATGPQPVPYSYTLYEEFNPVNIVSQGNVGFTAGLSSGNYVALVEDDLGCLYRDSFIIHPLDSVYIDSVIFTNVSCNDFNDGYINQIIPMGGTVPYEYSINGGGNKFPSWICNQNPNTCPTGYVFTGLAAGIHDVEIWDANGCANSYKITITQPEPMQVSITTNNYNNYQILCNGDTDSAVVNVSGGAVPYTLDITGGNSNSNTSITNSSGTFNPSGIFYGKYAFTITDANGCTYIDSIDFEEPAPIIFTAIVTDVFCSGANSGAITAIVAGGVGQGNGSNYTYEWYNGSLNLNVFSYNINNLVTGNYTIIATDANNCVGDTVIEIGQNALDITSSATSNVTCFEDCDGTITLNVSGGVPASSGATYTYLWNDALNQTINPAIGLCAGSYTCTVTDMAGCSVISNSILVSEPNEFIANIILDNAILCNGGAGDLSVTTTGGTNPISSYAWSDGTNLVTTTGLAGNYTCFVEDDNGCSDTANYNLVEPSVITILGVDTLDVKCKGESTGEIHITATGGTPIQGIPPTYNYELFNSTGSIQIITNALEAQFTGLSTGSYYVVVTDVNGCTYKTGNIFIDEPDNDLEITIDAYDETCNDDAYAIVYPTGGTSTYTFKWDNGSTNPSNGSDNSYEQNLTAGANTSHTIVVTDANGCEVSETITLLGSTNVFLPDNTDEYDATICLGETINIDIDEKIGLTYVWTHGGDTIAETADLTLLTDSSFSPIEIFTLTITDANCSESVVATITIDDLNPLCSSNKYTILLGESVSLAEIGNIPFDTYEWSNTNGVVLDNTSSFTYTPTQSDSFNLYVTDGICKGYCSVYITLGVLPFDAISPNGDGMNDTWVIKDLERYPDAIVKLFNRWGQLLLEIDGPAFPNNDFNWEDLTVGTYYYIIDLGNGDTPQTGPITIIK